MVHAAVIGARGYLGRELVRLLLQHPDVDRIAPASATQAGERFGDHVPAFRHSDLRFVAPDAPAVRDADAVFLATGHGEAAALLPRLKEAGHKVVVDLSRDHRPQGLAGADGWAYGLADLRPVPKGQRLVANPGCYPTAAVLAAAPALRAGLADGGVLIVDGKSGVSGAGASPRADLHFPDQNEAVRAYKVLGHDHGAEIRASAAHFEDGGAKGLPAGGRPVRFTPHLVPMNRGLLATVYLPLRSGVGADQVAAAYRTTYAGTTFVRIVPEPDTAAVRGSNHADVAADLDPDTGYLVARCAIDNLVKGGSGTAVQNMNHSLGLRPAAGLTAIGGGP